MPELSACPCGNGAEQMVGQGGLSGMITSKYQDQVMDIIGRIAGKVMKTKGTARLISSVVRNFL
jgi:hypothetical protein